MNRLPLLLPILALLMVIRSPVVHGVTVGADFLDVRLVNGSNNASGRVEVWYNGTWGTVCDDGWDLNDANVVCRMLGFFDASSAPGLAAYGAGSGKIHLDEVECTGSESSLEDCIKSEFGVHNCDHSEDAGVTCGDSPAFQPHIWIPKTRIEKPCLVPRNRGPVLQFVNGDETRPITSYYTLPTLPDGTKLVARCRDPGMYRLIGDQRRTCQGGQWTGEEPECQPVKTQVLFYGASHEVASNGTVVVYVHRGNPSYLDVVCYITSLWLRPPRLTTPLVNGGDLWNWPWFLTDAKRLNPISTDFSGIYTCNGSSSFHSVHVLFKAAECEAPEAPEHGRLLDGSRQEPRDIFPAGTTVSFECEDDYSLVGSMEITCEKGQWSDDPPVCTVSKCPVLNIPDHVVTESVHFSDGRNIGDERIFNCVEGYVLQGDTNNLRCLESGVWSAPLPTCEAAECEAPAAPEHGRLLDGSRQQARDIFPDGATVSFECEDDYSLVGYWEITCEKGQWSNDPPVCRVSKCPVLNIPDHVVTESVHFSDGRNIGDERIFNCVEGYVLQGDTNNLRCLESGVWSAPLPTCEDPDPQIRLIGGQTALEGRVEVFFDGSWGTVCDDFWDLNDVRVVCRMLGFQIAVRAVTNAGYGEGSGSIILDNVQCLGTERNLAECSHMGYENHDCGHSEDAGAVCANYLFFT